MRDQINKALRAEIEKQNVPLAALSGDLLRWYDRHARILPWREQPDPYRVWVSEIMLQQTRVEAVRPYFERFMEALPTVEALADAPEETLMKLWEGLGYYNRARNLQRAARMVVEQYGGVLPSSYEQLLSLPGIGEYTAGAVASIAYGIAVPAVDGNVLRVLSRLLASEADIAQPKVKAVFRGIAADMQPSGRPGDYNQAMMELGATVCVPASPRCAACPVAHSCMARQLDCAAALPIKSPKRERRREDRTVFLILCDGKVLIRKRAESGLLSGMWELPNVQGRLSEEQAIRQMEEWGIQTAAPREAGESKHVFTHVEWWMQGYIGMALHTRCTVSGEWAWASWKQLQESHAMPSAFRYYREVLQALLADE